MENVKGTRLWSFTFGLFLGALLSCIALLDTNQGHDPGVCKEVILMQLPADHELVTDWLKDGNASQEFLGWFVAEKHLVVEQEEN